MRTSHHELNIEGDMQTESFDLSLNSNEDMEEMLNEFKKQETLESITFKAVTQEFY